MKEAASRALKTTKSYVREYRIRNRAGEIRWLQSRAQIVCDARGKIDYITGVFFDITPQKELEKELQEYREHLERLVQERTAELIRVNEQLRMTRSARAWPWPSSSWPSWNRNWRPPPWPARPAR